MEYWHKTTATTLMEPGSSSKGCTLETPAVRVLVVDDYEPFRRFVCSTLEKRPELQIVGEASDGIEAVRKAEELQPDLIVLDIGLPKLNGIEAARRIQKLSPQGKILFLSQESSADVVQEALRSGGSGYILKLHAANDLLTAVETVRQGGQFIGDGLSGHRFTDTTDTQHRRHDEALPSLASKTRPGTRNHEVHFYSDDEAFLVGFTRFIEAVLLVGNAVIVVATEVHRKGLRQRLLERGVSLAAAIDEGRYTALDVTETLSTFMVNGLPDPIRFRKVTSDLVAAAAKAAKGEPPRVAACGECAPVLWAQGKTDGAIQLERLWDAIGQTCDVDILCGYGVNFQRGPEGEGYERICAEHSVVCTL